MKTPRHTRSAHASSIEPLEGRIAPSIITPIVTSIDRTTPATAETGASSVTYTVTFNEAVANVDAADFKVVTTGDAKMNGTLTVTPVDSSHYTITLNGLQGNGDVLLSLVDNNSIVENTSGTPGTLPLGGVGATDGSFTGPAYHLLQTMPKVSSITTDGTNPTSAANVSWTVTFSEAVNGVDAADFQLAAMGPSATLGTVTPINAAGGYATSYTVTATGITGTGPLGLRLVDDGSIKDTDSNPLQTNPVGVSTPYSQNSARYPVAVAAGDVNGDGKPDLVVANYNYTAAALAEGAQGGYSSGSVSVMLGNGDGSFQARQDFATLGLPRSVAIADVNGDGKLDIAATGSGFNVATSGFSNVSVLLGNGDGTFQAHQDYGDYEQSRAVAIADVTGDGRPDLVVTSVSGIGHVNVLVGNGNGTFQAPVKYTVGSEPNSVAVGDLNGDGQLDIVTGSFASDTVSVLVNATPKNTSSSVGLNFGSSTSFVTGSGPYSVALGDLNGDGNLDVVTANHGSSNVSVLLGNGTGGFGGNSDFSASSSIPATVALTDVNGDGTLDLVVTDGTFSPNPPTALPEQLIPTQQAHILLGAGNGTFGASTDISVSGTNKLGLAIADFNGDGRPDGAASDSSVNMVGTLLNTGNGSFTGEAFTIIPNPLDLTVSNVSHTGNNFGGGDAITFTISYANIGTINATGVKITVPLDSHAFFVASENAGWTRSGDLLTKTIGDLNTSGSGSTTLILHADYVVNDYNSTFSTTATISDDGTHGSDSVPKNDSYSDYGVYIGQVPRYNGFVVTAPGVAPKNQFAPPLVQVFDRTNGDLLYTFNAYENNYRDSVRVAVGDFNFDGIDDIVTTTQHNGGRMRFFDGSNGQQFTSGALSEEIPVFGTSKNSGAFVAVGNVNGYGFPEIVVGSALISKTVGGGKVKVYSLDNNLNALPETTRPAAVLQVIKEYTPFGTSFKGGVRVAVGDVDGFDNQESEALPESGESFPFQDDIIVGQGYRGGTVKVYKGATDTVLGTFKVGKSSFKGGVSVAVGDVNNDGHADIIVGRNTGKPSVVEVFDGSTLLPDSGPMQIGSAINPFDVDPLHPTNTFGVRVATADVNGDGVADIITSVGIKNQSIVKFYISTSAKAPGGREFILDSSRTLTAYEEFPNVALWVAGSDSILRQV